MYTFGIPTYIKWIQNHDKTYHEKKSHNHFLRASKQHKSKNESACYQIIGLVVHEIVDNSVKPSVFILKIRNLKQTKKINYILKTKQKTLNY